jgi:BlaI family transcriptional regulator, penicillinase repressor
MKFAQPSNLEMQVLSVLWDHGPLSARAVLERMPDGKARAYTTILSVLQVMEKKGFVKHEADGNRHVYAAKVQQRNVVRPLLTRLVKTLFRGSPSTAMQHLLDASEVNEADLVEMRKLLDTYSTEKGGRK